MLSAGTTCRPEGGAKQRGPAKKESSRLIHVLPPEIWSESRGTRRHASMFVGRHGHSADTKMGSALRAKCEGGRFADAKALSSRMGVREHVRTRDPLATPQRAGKPVFLKSRSRRPCPSQSAALSALLQNCPDGRAHCSPYPSSDGPKGRRFPRQSGGDGERPRPALKGGCTILRRR